MSLTPHHSCQWNDYPRFTGEETEAQRGKVTHLRKWVNWNLNSALTGFSTIFWLYSQNMYLPTFSQPHCYHLVQPLSHLSSLFPGLPEYVLSPHLFVNHTRHTPTSGSLHRLFLLPRILFPKWLHKLVSSVCSNVTSLTLL